MESPYLLKDTDTINEFYERWLADPSHIITLDDVVYYKIISKSKFTIDDKESFIVYVPCKCRIGQTRTLIDENSIEYTVIDVVKFHYCEPFKDWMFKTYAPLLAGDIEHIGEYLSSVELG